MSYTTPPSQPPRNAPNWWNRNTIPPSIDRLRTPNRVATVPLVNGTVDSHNSPMAMPNR
ncbi:hypothetical protein D3C87_2074670 [compost metagenome]